MVIDEKLIKYLEDLSFITLSNEERGRICTDLESIIAGMALLSELDTMSQQALSSQCITKPSVPALRKDQVIPSFPREEILTNAPQANGEAFVVPQTVE